LHHCGETSKKRKENHVGYVILLRIRLDQGKEKQRNELNKESWKKRKKKLGLKHEKR